MGNCYPVQQSIVQPFFPVRNTIDVAPPVDGKVTAIVHNVIHVEIGPDHKRFVCAPVAGTLRYSSVQLHNLKYAAEVTFTVDDVEFAIQVGKPGQRSDTHAVGVVLGKAVRQKQRIAEILVGDGAWIRIPPKCKVAVAVGDRLVCGVTELANF